MPEALYNNYGLNTGYLPKIYFNKITLEDEYASPKPDKSVLQYIDEDFKVVEENGSFVKKKVEWPSGFDPKKGNECVKVTVDASMLFLAPDFEAFKSIFTDDDFFKSLKIIMGFASGVKGEAPIEELPVFAYALGKTAGIDWWGETLLPEHIRSPLKSFLVSPKTITKVDLPPMAYSLYNAVFGVPHNQNDFWVDERHYEDLFNKCTKTLPNGFTYFELPLRIVHNIKANNLETLKIFAFTVVDDIEIDFSFKIADQEIKLDLNLSDVIGSTSLTGDSPAVGPLTMERVMENNKIQDVGILFTIGEDQSTGGLPAQQLLSLKREELYNDKKGEPWLGSVTLTSVPGVNSPSRYMAAAEENDLAPWLDITYVRSYKVTDVRSIKQLQNINVDFSSLEGLAKIGNVKYKNSKDELQFLNKKIYFSELMLAATNNSEGAKTINGFFGVDYINILHNNCLLPRLLEKIINKYSNSTPGTVDNFLAFQSVKAVMNKLKNTLNIKITRHEVNNNKLLAPKIIFESIGQDLNKIYPKQNYKTVNPNNNSDVLSYQAPLGYLTEVNISKASLLNENKPVEGSYSFFTFTDLDETKRNGIEYKYEIQLSFDDPMLSILGNLISLLNSAIKGAPGITPAHAGLIGLKKLVYIMDYYSTKKNPNMSLMAIINEVYGGAIATADKESVNPTTGILKTVEKVLDNNIIPLLLDNSKTGQDIPKDFAHAVKSAISIKDPNTTSLTNITMVLNLFESFHANLINIYDTFSKVNYSKDSGAGFSSKNSTKSVDGAKTDKFKITINKTFEETVHIDDVGLDYCALFSDASPSFPATTEKPTNSTKITLGNKIVTTANFKTNMINFLSTFYGPAINSLKIGGTGTAIKVLKNPSEEEKNPTLESVAGSFLPLTMMGVRLPDIKKEDIEDKTVNWNSLIQSLLLYNKGNRASFSQTNLQTGGQYGWNATLFEKELCTGEGAAFNKEQIRRIKSVEKNQQLLWDLGMATQDKIETITVESTQPNQPGGGGGNFPDQELVDSALGNMNTSVPTPKKIISTDINKNYFMSYVANYAENNLNYVNSLAPMPPFMFHEESVKNVPAPTLSLMLNAQNPTPFQALSPTYDSIYDHLFSQVAGHHKLFVSRLMEYYFRFFHCVEIFYLKGFGTYNAQALSMNPDPYSAMTGKTSDGTINVNPTLDTLESTTRPALNSFVWEKLTWNTIDALQKNDQIFCKIDNYNNLYYSATIEQTLKNFLMLDKYFIIKGT